MPPSLSVNQRASSSTWSRAVSRQLQLRLFVWRSISKPNPTTGWQWRVRAGSLSGGFLSTCVTSDLCTESWRAQSPPPPPPRWRRGLSHKWGEWVIIFIQGRAFWDWTARVSFLWASPSLCGLSGGSQLSTGPWWLRVHGQHRALSLWLLLEDGTGNKACTNPDKRSRHPAQPAPECVAWFTKADNDARWIIHIYSTFETCQKLEARVGVCGNQMGSCLAPEHIPDEGLMLETASSSLHKNSFSYF